MKQLLTLAIMSFALTAAAAETINCNVLSCKAVQPHGGVAAQTLCSLDSFKLKLTTYSNDPNKPLSILSTKIKGHNYDVMVRTFIDDNGGINFASVDRNRDYNGDAKGLIYTDGRQSIIQMTAMVSTISYADFYLDCKKRRTAGQN